jgi:ABC-type lipoprotein release transport system permease subunit
MSLWLATVSAMMKPTILNATMMEGIVVLILGVIIALNAIVLLEVKLHHLDTPNIMKTSLTQFGWYKFPLDRQFKSIFYTLIWILHMSLHAGKKLNKD